MMLLSIIVFCVMSKLIIISLSLLFLHGDIYANKQTLSKEDEEDIIIFGDDDENENDSTETDDISDAEDEEE
ncbi:MAG: hypothetical protein NEHIOOID_00448 [Holosporales bacterium]